MKTNLKCPLSILLLTVLQAACLPPKTGTGPGGPPLGSGPTGPTAGTGPRGVKASCSSCPVTTVRATAAQSLAPADRGHGCAAQTIGGLPVPDPKCTPGSINPTVTLDVLRDAAFRTACIRNCVSTEEQKAATYGLYNIPHPANNTGNTQVCELDHLVPLELGGADTLDNIWPQCGPDNVALAQRYFKRKDMVENYLAAQVKAGQIDLSNARTTIAKDWTQWLAAANDFCAKNPQKCGAAQ